MKTLRSNGKLLLTAEYVVLDGATALAVPTTYGQNLTIEANNTRGIQWKSYNEKGLLWFEDEFTVNGNEILKQSQKFSGQDDNPITSRLLEILNATKQLNPKFLNSNTGYTISTHLDFNRHWGLGTSSTLINNIANWAKIDPYLLLKKTFGGSGYDIACAQHTTPILYRIKDAQPVVNTAVFNPIFKDHLYFVYLNKKQNSRDGIKAYKTLGKIKSTTLTTINAITQSLVDCTSLTDFESLIVKHETIIAHLIQQQPIKQRLFSDFNGEIKSLGAWGGDFILVSSTSNPKDYFYKKGFKTIIPYTNMVK
ncbi:GYDIA family GHMP kinase [uncultured Winogradskyella sp.]|uniref:GYDIA family GHMP kinase n=1 Tax=uncultured Winogradskyella sp. TaxID=395353 RepID=UPI00262C7B35|nr:GYDIA family GHMP kinase [uncultured Winogradskyella sp.]